MYTKAESQSTRSSSLERFHCHLVLPGPSLVIWGSCPRKRRDTYIFKADRELNLNIQFNRNKPDEKECDLLLKRYEDRAEMNEADQLAMNMINLSDYTLRLKCLIFKVEFDNRDGNSIDQYYDEFKLFYF